ncbi:hypothetical protein V6N12_035554 [Hibiscus sabdariffa]|uniref:Uncharacterized protein n=1 Tax=Hibiscus sabdariffa TaxID=183260 RepID=A0ABR2ENE0_9ROSI
MLSLVVYLTSGCRLILHYFRCHSSTFPRYVLEQGNCTMDRSDMATFDVFVLATPSPFYPLKKAWRLSFDTLGYWTSLGPRLLCTIDTCDQKELFSTRSGVISSSCHAYGALLDVFGDKLFSNLSCPFHS